MATKRTFNSTSSGSSSPGDLQSKLAGLQSRLGDITSAQSKGYQGDTEEGAADFARSLSSPSGSSYSGGGVQSTSDMMSEFGSVFAPERETIMDSYRSARGQVDKASEASKGLIESRYGTKMEDEQQAGELALDRTKEQDIGFARSPIMLSLMASESEKRIRGLQKDKQELLMANDYEKAKELSKLIVDEQTAITTARVNMLNEYFGFRSEARADAGEVRSQDQARRDALSFRTPEQTAVIDLASKFPDSGITEEDTLATAQQKVRQSSSYLQNIRKGEADIAASQASAANSLASARKTGIETAALSAPANGSMSSQIPWLKTVAQDALKLADASGPSGLKKTAGDLFVGDSKFRQLETYTNTLRTNMLTLFSDPDIKKFFGPQMTENDVKLMTSASTIMNPEINSPTQMKTEINRVIDLISRMEGSVPSESRSLGTSNTITAPDGTVIQIID